ncbi:hypothetical protein GCM10023198_00130 [Promicromonospora umidemergens]|uniref:Uncharacterized protein n=1 Tax=Promicromonospora umidemergens TaxID=629679 RepID=A0ABP8WBX8_9MICO
MLVRGVGQAALSDQHPAERGSVLDRALVLAHGDCRSQLLTKLRELGPQTPCAPPPHPAFSIQLLDLGLQLRHKLVTSREELVTSSYGWKAVDQSPSELFFPAGHDNASAF